MTQPKYKMNRSPNEDEHWCRIYTNPFSFTDQKIPALTSWKGGYRKNGFKNPRGCTSKQNAYSKAFNNLLNQLSGIMKIRSSIYGSWVALEDWKENNDSTYQLLEQKIKDSINWVEDGNCRIGKLSSFALENAMKAVFV